MVKSTAKPVAESPDRQAPALHASVYDELRRRIVTGKIMPGVGLSTRGLAVELGVSQMPVRDALSRLAAEGAVQIRSKRKVDVPAMTPNRFADLLACRLLLEPEAAVLALPHISKTVLKQLRSIDHKLDQAMEDGNVIGYMESNYQFHFTIYKANQRSILNRLIEPLWLQFGPFMRVICGRFGTAHLVDQHRVALDAIEARDAKALRNAIASDIRDGMGIIAQSAWAETRTTVSPKQTKRQSLARR